MKDNLSENGVGDYIIDDTNVSEILRKNRSEYFKVKEQRNKEARKTEFYINCFEITLAILVMIIILFISNFVLNNETNEKGLEYCKSQGYSYEYCKKGL